MTRRIAVLTTTRAEYGLLQWVIEGLHEAPGVELQLVVGGTHLADGFGRTVEQIERDGWPIAARLDFLDGDDSPAGVGVAMGRATVAAAEAFARLRPDLLVVLGDRYETIAVALAAVAARIPIAHISGGEITEGAIDDAIRHALTKLSHLHFTSTEAYRRRVLQLGEDPELVWNVGSPAIDNIRRLPMLSRAELGASLGLPLDRPYLAVTYHPVTLAAGAPDEGLRAVLGALDACPELDAVMTFPNADSGGRALIAEIEAYAAAHADRVHVVASLGQLRYLSLMHESLAVLGNSSSGIVEAPSLGVPTVDVGDRQLGRIRAASVIGAAEDAADIVRAIRLAADEGFRRRAKAVVSPFGDGHASERIVQRLLEVDPGRLRRKRFVDREGEAA